MRGGWRIALAMAFTAVCAVAAAAFAQTGVAENEEAGAPEQRRQRLERLRERTEDGQRGHPRHRRPFGRMVHGEFTVQTRDGFATMIVDHGRITDVDADAGTVTIERADGETVTVTASADTKIRKDREEATLADLEEGDLARIVQRDGGDERVVRLIGAHTPRADEEAAGPAGPPAGPAFFAA